MIGSAAEDPIPEHANNIYSFFNLTKYKYFLFTHNMALNCFFGIGAVRSA